MKRYVVLGNRFTGNGGPAFAAMVMADFNEIEPLVVQLARLADSCYFDERYGVVAIEAAAAIGGPFGRGPA